MDYNCIEVYSKESMINTCINTPYSKGLCFIEYSEWYKMMRSIKNDFTHLNPILKHAFIDFSNNCLDWYIHKVKFDQYSIPESYLGFCAETIILLFSDNCPEKVIKSVKNIYLY